MTLDLDKPIIMYDDRGKSQHRPKMKTVLYESAGYALLSFEDIPEPILIKVESSGAVLNWMYDSWYVENIEE